jgi:hypothetical protein
VAPPSSGVLLTEGGGDTGVTRGRSRARVVNSVVVVMSLL